MPNFVSDFGFGMYNMSGNNVGLSVVGVVAVGAIFAANPKLGALAIKFIGDHGEDKLSKQGIEAGTKIMKAERSHHGW